MIRNIIVALVLVCALSGVGNTAETWYCFYDGDETGVFTHSHTGTYEKLFYWGSCEELWVKWYIVVVGNQDCRISRWYNGDCQCAVGDSAMYSLFSGSNDGIYHITGASNNRGIVVGDIDSTWGLTQIKIIVSNTSMTEYTVSGTTGCVNEVELHIYNPSTDSYYELESDSSCATYTFDVLDGFNYTLKFDTFEYNFTVNGSNIEYNYDACIKTWYHFKESCGNLIPDSEGFYIEKIGSTVHAANNFYTPSGILTISESPADNIYVSANPFSGQIGWFLDPIVNDTIYTLTNPIISWSLKVIVQNESTGDLINDAMVRVNQSCYCTDGYSTRQKLTINGHTDFTDMSLQDAGLFVMASGYKILDESSTGYAVFLSGRTNFSSKTWVVKLAPSWSENESTFYESNNTVNIFFKNEDGNRTSKILDTDSEVYLYYENNNTNEEDMTLRFESSSTHTHFMSELQWNIPYGEIGHKTIPQLNFTPWDYSYRAVIYNSSIYGWNMTIPLTVRNATKEENQHYENLSTALWFMYADDGKVDYRNDMNIGVHACSNNTSLMYVDIELYKDNVLLCYKNMTSNNFINADFPYYYVWNPVFDYVSGSNYSIRMYGFDRTLLETDYVECVTDDTTRKNKLTIGIKDKYGTNLNNCYIYLENWGSLPTGSLYYNSYEGIDNGDYRYKASKLGYTGGGWESVNLADEDKIVWYVLSEDYINTSIAATKFTDNDIKGFFFPLMYFLLICIVLGGLKYVTQ